MIDSLTEAQKARKPEYVDKWIAIGLSTDAANKPVAEEAIKLAYKVVDIASPKVVWCESPFHACKEAVGINNMKRATKERKSWYQEAVWASIYAQFDAPWLAFYDFFREVIGLKEQT